jgi:PKHD-type hydroxylase
MRNYWEMWPEGLPTAYCDMLVERAQKRPMIEAVVHEGEYAASAPDIRRSTLRWFDVDGEDRDVATTIMYFARKANRNSFGFEIVEPVQIQFAEYLGTERGSFDWHQDVNWTAPTMTDRKLSFIAQLSEPSDYEGGDFEFFGYPPPGPDFKKRGSVLMFPSFLHHRVTPVTAGVRYSLSSWVEGPKFC